VWDLLGSYFPDRFRPQHRPTCLTIAPDFLGGPTRSGPACQLERSGFAVTPLLLRRGGPGGAASSSGNGSATIEGTHKCCLQVAGEQAAAHVGGEASRPWNGADVVCFADTMHLVDMRRALQASLCGG